MVTIVFGGPSLRGIDLSGKPITVLPPAAQGDLLAAVRTLRPNAVGLLDCDLPHRALPTWHKEILSVLHRGIPVVGAAAVGAHRAAELAPQGMEGVGSIFRRVASGELERDDEVLGDWERTEDGIRIVSLPLVVLRDGIAAARERNILSGETAGALTGLAEGLFWRNRTWETLLDAAQRAGLFDEELHIFREWLPEAPDPVWEDANALLSRLEDLGKTEVSWNGTRCPEEDSALFKSLDERDRPVPSRSGPVRQWSIGDLVSFAHPEAEDLNARALNRKLVLLLASLWGLVPEEQALEHEKKRLRRRFSLKTDEDFARWMAENDLDEDHLRRLLEEEARIHHLHRWFMQGRIHGKNTGAILDELRLRGGYGTWKEKAGRREALLRDHETTWRELWRQASTMPVATLLREHLRAEGFPWHGTMFLDAVPETGMEIQDILDEILAAKTARTFWSRTLGTPEPSEGPSKP